MEDSNAEVWLALEESRRKYFVNIQWQICSINQGLNNLTLDINTNLTVINEVRSKANDLTFCLETSQNIWETEN